MDEAISKASVCEILADIYPTDGEKVISVERIDEAYDKIIKLPTIRNEPHWIPCSERLPKEYGNYLITTHNGDVDVGTIVPKKKGVWSACDADGFYWIREVVAWMPLPKPPKEDDNDHT